MPCSFDNWCGNRSRRKRNVGWKKRRDSAKSSKKQAKGNKHFVKWVILEKRQRFVDKALRLGPSTTQVLDEMHLVLGSNLEQDRISNNSEIWLQIVQTCLHDLVEPYCASELHSAVLFGSDACVPEEVRTGGDCAIRKRSRLSKIQVPNLQRFTYSNTLQP